MQPLQTTYCCSELGIVKATDSDFVETGKLFVSLLLAGGKRTYLPTEFRDWRCLKLIKRNGYYFCELFGQNVFFSITDGIKLLMAKFLPSV
jgi:hypothetical protein